MTRSDCLGRSRRRARAQKGWEAKTAARWLGQRRKSKRAPHLMMRTMIPTGTRCTANIQRNRRRTCRQYLSYCVAAPAHLEACLGVEFKQDWFCILDKLYLSRQAIGSDIERFSAVCKLANKCTIYCLTRNAPLEALTS